MEVLIQLRVIMPTRIKSWLHSWKLNCSHLAFLSSFPSGWFPFRLAESECGNTLLYLTLLAYSIRWLCHSVNRFISCSVDCNKSDSSSCCTRMIPWIASSLLLLIISSSWMRHHQTMMMFLQLSYHFFEKLLKSWKEGSFWGYTAASSSSSFGLDPSAAAAGFWSTIYFSENTIMLFGSLYDTFHLLSLQILLLSEHLPVVIFMIKINKLDIL